MVVKMSMDSYYIYKERITIESCKTLNQKVVESSHIMKR